MNPPLCMWLEFDLIQGLKPWIILPILDCTKLVLSNPVIYTSSFIWSILTFIRCLSGVYFLCSYLNSSDHDLPNQFSPIRMNYFLYSNKNTSYFFHWNTRDLWSLFSRSVLISGSFPIALRGRAWQHCLIKELNNGEGLAIVRWD